MKLSKLKKEFSDFDIVYVRYFPDSRFTMGTMVLGDLDENNNEEITIIEKSFGIWKPLNKFPIYKIGDNFEFIINGRHIKGGDVSAGISGEQKEEFQEEDRDS